MRVWTRARWQGGRVRVGGRVGGWLGGAMASGVGAVGWVLSAVRACGVCVEMNGRGGAGTVREVGQRTQVFSARRARGASIHAVTERPHANVERHGAAFLYDAPFVARI